MGYKMYNTVANPNPPQVRMKNNFYIGNVSCSAEIDVSKAGIQLQAIILMGICRPHIFITSEAVDGIEFFNHGQLDTTFYFKLSSDYLCVQELQKLVNSCPGGAYDPDSNDVGAKFITMTLEGCSQVDGMFRLVDYNDVKTEPRPLTTSEHEEYQKKIKFNSAPPPTRVTRKSMRTSLGKSPVVVTSQTSESSSSSSNLLSLSEDENDEKAVTATTTVDMDYTVDQSNFILLFKVANKLKSKLLQQQVMEYVADVPIDISWPLQLIQERDEHLRTRVTEMPIQTVRKGRGRRHMKSTARRKQR